LKKIKVGLSILAASLSLVIGSNVELVTQASAISYHIVTFSENLPKGTSLVASQASSVAAPLKLVGTFSPAFLNPGYAFRCWNTNINGSGIAYGDGATYSFSSDVILYAQWVPSNHVVTFNQNRSLSDTVFSYQVAATPTPLKTFASLTPPLSNPGFAFANWNTKANGTGVRYTNGQTYSFAADLTLYAQWVKSTAALNFVGTVSNSPSLKQLSHVAVQILHNHFHQVQVVQFRHQNGAVVLGLLTKLLVQHDGPGITVALRRSDAEVSSPGVEIFAN